MIRALLACALLLLIGCAKREYVVLYTSQDQFYAEPILKEFTEKTGIEVRTVFDTESAKTAALAHRIRAEKNNPQCDVFWSNEEMHTRLLANEGVVYMNTVADLGYRSRRLVINTNLLAVNDVPKSLLELTNQNWLGKVVVAYPLFGTTSSHFLALRAHWGDVKWRAWCEGLARNAKIVDGNSVVVRLVGAGECVIGLTDSDDVEAGLRQNLPIASVSRFKEPFIIPNTISIVSHAPRPKLAQRLIDFLADAETVEALIDFGALEGRKPPVASSLPVSWNAVDPKRGTWKIHDDLQKMNEELKHIFLRS